MHCLGSVRLPMGKRAALRGCRCRCSHKSTTRSHPTRSSSPTTPPAQPRAVAPARPRISQTSCGRQWCAASSASRVFPFSAANHASFSAVQFRAAFACGEWSCRAMPCSLHAVPCRPMPCHAWCCASTGAAGGRAAVDFEHRRQWHVRPRRLLHHLGPDPCGKPPLAIPDCVCLLPCTAPRATA